MKTITKTYDVFSFDELDEDARQNALEKLWDINVDHEWWNFTFEDARNIGLKITEFDLDRNRYAKGEFIDPAPEVAEKILSDHGKDCETYKTAKAFLDTIKEEYPNNDYDYDEIIEKDFLYSLLEDYSIMLQKEYEYLTSEEAIIETIKANDYQFDKEGNLI